MAKVIKHIKRMPLEEVKDRSTIGRAIESGRQIYAGFGEHTCFHEGNRANLNCFVPARVSDCGEDAEETVAEFWPCAGNKDGFDAALVAHNVNTHDILLENLQYIDYAIGGDPDEDYADEEIIEIRITGKAVKDIKKALKLAENVELPEGLE
jgi:hypothetical protein